MRRLSIAAIILCIFPTGGAPANLLEDLFEPIEYATRSFSRGLTGGAREDAEMFLATLEATVRSIIADADNRTEERLSQVQGIVDSSISQLNTLVDRFVNDTEALVGRIDDLRRQTVEDLIDLEKQFFADVHCTQDKVREDFQALYQDIKEDFSFFTFRWLLGKTECEEKTGLDLEDISENYINTFRYEECRVKCRIVEADDVQLILDGYAQLRIKAGQLHCASSAGEITADDWYWEKKRKLDVAYQFWK